MAYMNQERKAKLAANLKKVVPKGWKYSLAVDNYSTIVMTISEAPVDILEAMYQFKLKNPRHAGRFEPIEKRDHASVNPYWLDTQFEGVLLVTFKDILEALNDGNHNRSDIMSDYHDVGWYVNVNIGKWNKPFKVAA